MRNINTRKRRYQQRVARRKQKVQQLIQTQKARRAALDSVVFLHRQDYLRAMHKIQTRLGRLNQELRVLEAGQLLEIGIGKLPEEPGGDENS